MMMMMMNTRNSEYTMFNTYLQLSLSSSASHKQSHSINPLRRTAPTSSSSYPDHHHHLNIIVIDFILNSFCTMHNMNVMIRMIYKYKFIIIIIIIIVRFLTLDLTVTSAPYSSRVRTISE